jgi:hypothetical protein
MLLRLEIKLVVEQLIQYLDARNNGMVHIQHDTRRGLGEALQNAIDSAPRNSYDCWWTALTKETGYAVRRLLGRIRKAWQPAPKV